jgi:hypothetical protein
VGYDIAVQALLDVGVEADSDQREGQDDQAQDPRGAQAR